MADENINQAQEKILENIANPVSSHAVDGEKTELKDPLRQLQAMELLARQRAARNPLGAIGSFRFPSGSGER
ncbi:MAG: hypothetical protein GX937_02395 [Lentisphaerae bacterium]|jgi:hypothetical protein|nr:hypothetical protein [Lentisphaerota bacterium]